MGGQGSGVVLKMIWFAHYVLIVAFIWGMAFGLPVGAAAGIVGGTINGLLALGFYRRLPPGSASSYRAIAGAMAAISNALVAAWLLPRLSSAYGRVGPMHSDALLVTVILPALLAGWAGWAARGRFGAWYGRGVGSVF